MRTKTTLQAPLPPRSGPPNKLQALRLHRFAPFARAAEVGNLERLPKAKEFIGWDEGKARANGGAGFGGWGQLETAGVDKQASLISRHPYAPSWMVWLGLERAEGRVVVTPRRDRRVTASHQVTITPRLR